MIHKIETMVVNDIALKIGNLKVTAARALTSAINIEYTTSVLSVVHNLYKYN